MAQERYGFFNSTSGDTRSYDAADMAAAFHTLASDGVAQADDCLRVTAEGSTMRTLVSYGAAMVQGYFYQLRDDGSGIQALEHPTETELNRIDRVVLRLDLSARIVTLVKKMGTASATPVAPALTRSSESWELSLAQVYIHAGAAEVTETDITDERKNDVVCGLIAPESLRLSAVERLIAESTDSVIRFTGQALEEAQKEQARKNIGAPSANDVRIKLYTALADVGLAETDSLSLQDICAVLPDDSVLFYNPLPSSAGNISPAASRAGTLIVTRKTAERINIKFYPAADESVWTNCITDAAGEKIGEWKQMTPAAETMVVLAAASWIGTGPYTQAAAVPGMQAGKKAIVGLSHTASGEQYLAAVAALLHVTAQGSDTLTVTAEGDAPAVDIPILVEIVG